MKLQKNLKTSTILLAIASLMSVGNFMAWPSIFFGSHDFVSIAWDAVEVVIPVVPLALIAAALSGGTKRSLASLHLVVFLFGFVLPVVTNLLSMWVFHFDSLMVLEGFFGLNGSDIVWSLAELSIWPFLAAFVAFRTATTDTEQASTNEIAKLRASRERHKTRGIWFGLGGGIGCAFAPFIAIAGLIGSINAQMSNDSQGQAASSSLAGFGGIALGVACLVLITLGIRHRRMAKDDRLAADGLERQLATQNRAPAKPVDPTQVAVTPVAKINRPEADAASNEDE